MEPGGGRRQGAERLRVRAHLGAASRDDRADDTRQNVPRAGARQPGRPGPHQTEPPARRRDPGPRPLQQHGRARRDRRLSRRLRIVGPRLGQPQAGAEPRELAAMRGEYPRWERPGRPRRRGPHRPQRARIDDDGLIAAEDLIESLPGIDLGHPRPHHPRLHASLAPHRLRSPGEHEGRGRIGSDVSDHPRAGAPGTLDPEHRRTGVGVRARSHPDHTAGILVVIVGWPVQVRGRLGSGPRRDV